MRSLSEVDKVLRSPRAIKKALKIGFWFGAIFSSLCGVLANIYQSYIPFIAMSVMGVFMAGYLAYVTREFHDASPSAIHALMKALKQ